MREFFSKEDSGGEWIAEQKKRCKRGTKSSLQNEAHYIALFMSWVD